MNKDIESAHKDAYHNQRQKRWTMENQNASKILKIFSVYLLKKLPFLSKDNINFSVSINFGLMLIHLRIMNGLKVARILYVHYPIVKENFYLLN